MFVCLFVCCCFHSNFSHPYNSKNKMTHYGKGQDVDIPIVAPSAVTEIRSDAEVPSSVQVTAPADLQEGYKFQVEVNGKSMTVGVPPGGVRQGDVFTAVPQFGGTDTRPNLDIPMNTWRDGLCDCCALGCCHPALCMGIWFTPSKCHRHRHRR